MGLFDDIINTGDTGGANNNFLSSAPIIGQMFDRSGQQALDQLRANQGIYAGQKAPNLQWNTYSPAAVNPLQAEGNLVHDDPMVRSAQMSALAKMGDLANTGLSDVDQAGFAQARDLGNQMARSGSQAAMQNAQARGIGGSGMEFANREIANQQGAQRAQQAGVQQAADAARQRALYNQAYQNALGGMQQQQTNLSGQNAGILNQFNMANTNAANQARMYNNQNQNQAQLMNNQGRNNVAQQNFNNQMGINAGRAGANTGIANGYYAQNAANTAGRNANTQMGFQMLSGDGFMGMGGKGGPSSGGGGGGGGNNGMAMAGGAMDEGGMDGMGSLMMLA